MKNIKKIIRNRLIASILFSLITILGIIFIILGLSLSKKTLLILGLVFVFLNVYLLPLIWFNYIAWRYYLKIYKLIVEEEILNTFAIADKLNKKDKDITKAVNILIENDLLLDYRFVDQTKLVKIKK
ncbi:MAG: hypothetical protein J6Y42_01565 [Bacilli bacterium]|nr:hypothetical protein [Bacilli bacterium]